jgi:hypothetical protein
MLDVVSSAIIHVRSAVAVFNNITKKRCARFRHTGTTSYCRQVILEEKGTPAAQDNTRNRGNSLFVTRSDRVNHAVNKLQKTERWQRAR